MSLLYLIFDLTNARAPQVLECFRRRIFCCFFGFGFPCCFGSCRLSFFILFLFYIQPFVRCPPPLFPMYPIEFSLVNTFCRSEKQTNARLRTRSTELEIRTSCDLRPPFPCSSTNLTGEGVLLLLYVIN